MNWAVWVKWAWLVVKLCLVWQMESRSAVTFSLAQGSPPGSGVPPDCGGTHPGSAWWGLGA